MAALLAFVGLAAPSAHADTGWYSIGGATLNPVNHETQSDGGAPQLTTDADADPYLAWTEDDPVGGFLKGQARVAQYAGPASVSRPWTELLGKGNPDTPSQYSLNANIGDNAGGTDVTIVNGTPYAAFLEPDSQGYAQVHVDYWSGTRWYPLGGLATISLSPTALSEEVSIGRVVIGGTAYPLAAWTENVNNNLEAFAKVWDGSAWHQLGATVSSTGASEPEGLQVSNALGAPTVAWTEVPAGSTNGAQVVRLASWTGPVDGSSGGWVQAPGTISNPSGTASSPSAIDAGGHVVVSYATTATTGSGGGTTTTGTGTTTTGTGTTPTLISSSIAVVQQTGSTWAPLGSGPPNAVAGGAAVDPVITVTNAGTLWLAWSEEDASGAPSALRVASYNLNTSGPWTASSEINYDDSQNAIEPSIIDASASAIGGAGGTAGGPDTPMVAWSETANISGNTHAEVRAAALGVPVTNTARPSISGTPLNGDTLTCNTGQWTVGSSSTMPTLTSVWERGARGAAPDDPSWSPIPNQTGPTYTVQATDDGFSLRCLVTATYQSSSAQAASNVLRADAGAPTLTDISYPRVEGSPVVPNTLTCDPGPSVSDPNAAGWHNNPSFTYQWLSNGQVIAGATGPTLTLVRYRDNSGQVIYYAGTGGHQISCVVIGANDLGSETGASVAVSTYDAPPMPTTKPTVTVIPDTPSAPSATAESLGCSNGSWLEGVGNYAYQWLRNETPISGATSSTYRVSADDYGRYLSCEVTDTNPAGTSVESESASTLIAIPTGSDDVAIHLEPGANGVSPTSMVASTQRYRSAIGAYTVSELQQGIKSATATCTSEAAQHNWPAINQGRPINVPLSSEEDRCRVLLGDPAGVTAEPTEGVRWTGYGHGCSGQSGIASQLCPDLGIQVTPIDPDSPPQVSAGELSTVGPATPAEYIWDLDGNGTTDAICPASAPVLSSIFNDNSRWHPTVTVVDEDGTVHTGEVDFSTGTGAQSGTLRSSQIKVCETSFDPPPTPQLPCITAGQIGSVTISNANLCPIDARQLSEADLEQLENSNVDGASDLSGYLLAASEGELADSGGIRTDRAARARPDGGPMTTDYVHWSQATEPNVRVAIRPARGPHVVSDHLTIGTGSVPASTLAATTASSVATFSSENSLLTYAVLKLPSAVTTKPAAGRPGIFQAVSSRGPSFFINLAKSAIAYNQIYVARGPGAMPGSSSSGDAGALDAAANAANSVIPGVTGDTGEALINGVGLSAVPDAGQATSLLLAGSDVGGALPNVKSFVVTGRNLAASMGVPTCTSVSDCKTVALGTAHAYATSLKDDLTAQGKAAATQALQGAATNLDAMTQTYQQDASAYGKSLYDKVKDSLDVGPFQLSGDPSVKLNPDGTATLTISVTLPGLTGGDFQRDASGQQVLDENGNPKPVNGSPIKGTATFHADLQGHLALRGVTIDVADAYFLGIALHGVHISYDSSTGFDLQAHIVLAALGGAMVDINNFKLDQNGGLQDLNVDYKAGAGSGIPIFPLIELTEIGFDLDTEHSAFSATVGVSIGSSAGAGCVPLGATGTVSVDLKEPVSVHGVVSPQIFCLPLASITFNADALGDVSLDGDWGFSSPLVSFDAKLGADFGRLNANSPYVFQVYAHGSGSVLSVINGSLDAVLSSRGMAACGKIDIKVPVVSSLISAVTGDSGEIHLKAGATESFKNGVPLNPAAIISGFHVFLGCGIGSYYPLGVPKGVNVDAPGASPAQTFRVPAHRGPTVVELTGAGSAPRVTLISPSGQRYDLTSTGQYGSRLAHGAWGSIVDSEAKTVIVLPQPVGGVWTAQLAAGSAKIVSVSAAPILPPPTIKAKLSGAGATRVLHYTAVREPGETMRIIEQAGGMDHLLGVVAPSAKESLAHGTIRYTLGEAPSPRRTIVAQISQNGQPGQTLTLAHYRAANPRVGTVIGLTVRRHGHRALISWKPGVLDHDYAVQISYANGASKLTLTTQTKVLSQAITKTEGLRVSVIANSAANRAGAPASATLPGTMRLGIGHTLGPWKAKPAKGTATRPKAGHTGTTATNPKAGHTGTTATRPKAGHTGTAPSGTKLKHIRSQPR